ncbi:hypothetical protein [Ignavibacterium album]|uniref:hypothetical protein n=1 Tax=Ignavibacterium album TaxID=591197 RepID=UPI0026E9F27A|nr:hypothetical protein [Ignavibacterium album]
MIENSDQYHQALTVLQRTETALVALRQKVEPVNPELFQAMAQSYLDEIIELRNEIDEFIGLNIASEAKAPLWFSLEGEGLKTSEISSRLLSNWLTKFRIALQNVSEYLDTKRLITGRPSAAILASADPKLVALSTGSIKIGLKFPSSYIQGELFQDENELAPLPERALDRLLTLVAWVDSNQNELPRNIFPDDTETSVIVDQVISLIPSKRSLVKTLRFSGALVPSPTSLFINVESRPKLHQLREQITTIYEDTVEGVIREIDLDAQRIILRERGPEAPDLKCYLPDELVNVAEQLLDKYVRVRGKISSASPDVVETILIEQVNVP